VSLSVSLSDEGLRVPGAGLRVEGPRRPCVWGEGGREGGRERRVQG
jgi:hypothetical protein